MDGVTNAAATVDMAAVMAAGTAATTATVNGAVITIARPRLGKMTAAGTATGKTRTGRKTSKINWMAAAPRAFGFRG